MSALKCVLFDCWGTVITYSVKDHYFAAQVILDNCDNPENVTIEQIVLAWDGIMSTYYKTMHTFESTIESLVNGLCECLGLKPRIPVSKLADISYASQYNPTMIEGVDRMFAWLKKNNIPYGICSNTIYSAEQTKRQIALAIPETGADFVLASSEIGFKKPNTFFFDVAARKAGFNPEECVYIGDYFAADAYGSFNAGYGKSIWLNKNGATSDPELKDIIRFTECHNYDEVIDELKKEFNK